MTSAGILYTGPQGKLSQTTLLPSMYFTNEGGAEARFQLYHQPTPQKEWPKIYSGIPLKWTPLGLK